MKKIINSKLTKLLAYFFGILVYFSVSGCGANTNIIQTETATNASSNTALPFATPNNRAQVFLISLYSQPCVIDCPGVQPVLLYLNQQSALGALFAGNFNCIEVNPGQYTISTKNMNNITLHLEAGKVYYVAVKTTVSLANQQTTELSFLSPSQGKHYINKEVAYSKQMDQYPLYPSVMKTPTSCTVINN